MPPGAFYLFFAIDGMRDSTATTLRIIDEAKVGFAPGATFGPGGEGHLRMCFLRDPGEAGRGSGPLRPMAADEPPRMIARAGLAFSRKAY